MKKTAGTFVILFLMSTQVWGALPKYQVNMRIGMKGVMPISVNSAVKSGKKASFSEISSDGQTETLVEFVPKKSSLRDQKAVLVDVKVTKFVRGQKRAEERAQILAVENQEAEMTSGKKKNPDLSIAVMAHSI